MELSLTLKWLSSFKEFFYYYLFIWVPTSNMSSYGSHLLSLWSINIFKRCQGYYFTFIYYIILYVLFSRSLNQHIELEANIFPLPESLWSCFCWVFFLFYLTLYDSTYVGWFFLFTGLSLIYLLTFHFKQTPPPWISITSSTCNLFGLWLLSWNFLYLILVYWQ